MKPFAFVFPGQGSQSVGMLDAWGGHPAVAQALQEASDALDEDIGKLIGQGPKEALALTTNTQPVMLVAAIAAYRAWRAEGGAEPTVVAGHSLGEYSALVASGVLTLAQAAPLVRFRAQAMQEAVPEGAGAMAAILSLDDDGVRAACAEAGGAVQAVNFNAPGQVVIAGEKQAVARAIEACKARGAKRAMPLPVSAPFHSSLLKPAGERLKGYLEKLVLREPRIPVLNNVDVQAESEPGRIKDALSRQAYSPVRWVETIQRMVALGATHIVECGPGKVLAGMTKRIDAGVQSFTLSDRASLEQALQAIKGG
jgi:[acyl-carrier-protein] S-malonyltransferase